MALSGVIEQIKLEPCPFCEGPPCITARDYITDVVVAIDRPQDEYGDEVYVAHVWCHECGAEGPHVDSCDLCLVDDLFDLTVLDVMRIAAERWNGRQSGRARAGYDSSDAQRLNLFPSDYDIEALASKEDDAMK